MRYYWQAAVECVIEVSGERYLKLRRMGECVWPFDRPLKDNRAIKSKPETLIDHDERRCADALAAG